jgi:hypothetical protein
MRTNFRNLLKPALILAVVMCCFSCNRCEKLPIPQRPLIIIEITSIEQKVGTYVYQYKLIDKNGYVFYQTESSGFGDQPKRMLGDSIK